MGFLRALSYKPVHFVQRKIMISGRNIVLEATTHTVLGNIWRIGPN